MGVPTRSFTEPVARRPWLPWRSTLHAARRTLQVERQTPHVERLHPHQRKVSKELTPAPQCALDPRCAQQVSRRSRTENNSYMPMAIAPTTTRPAKARPICIELPADTSR